MIYKLFCDNSTDSDDISMDWGAYNTNATDDTHRSIKTNGTNNLDFR